MRRAEPASAAEAGLSRAGEQRLSPPRRSSAIRSSQPPTWVSPMKICGTVRRPVSWIIVVALGRAAGRRGSRRSARRRAASAAPWRGCSTGRSRVLYIFTHSGACSSEVSSRGAAAHAAAVFSTGRLAARQAARPPASARAFSKPSFFSTRDGARRARAGRADDDQRQRLVLRQLARGLEAGRAARCARPTAWPAAYSAGSLTSISTAFSRLIRRTASAALTAPPPTPPLQRRPQQQAAGERARRRRDTSCRGRSSRSWRALSPIAAKREL